MAQDVTVKATIDSTSIRIGEQTAIHLQVIKEKTKNLRFPIITDSLCEGIEVVAISPCDTVNLTDASEQINQTILITSFDSIVATIPPFKFIDGKDTLKTNALTFKVVPIEVDSIRQGLYDIKPIYSPPFNWLKFFLWIIGIILVCVLFFLGYRFYIRWKSKQSEVKLVVKDNPINPYELAKNQLKQIADVKLWQGSDVKGYYTILTDILRQYIEGRFDIDAKEMTSDQLIDELSLNCKRLNISNEALSMLSKVSKEADLVKFAKWIPLMEENKQAYDYSDIFVELTRPTSEQQGKGEEL